RGMQLAHGVGPMQFVREVRLDAIRQALLCGRPEETSVTRIAEDFGLSHLGRFANAYQRRFCERPIDTLKRY
ncbi:MAG: helix-turn-helix domain-containing protein, partial [Pseudomonadales bacterium]